jgi:riboflavin kinase/FMN adenylyltransferase
MKQRGKNGGTGMKLIQGTDLSVKHSCIAFGRFESMHRGHRLVINHLIEQEAKGLNSMILCLGKEKSEDNELTKEIYTIEEKAKLIEKNGPMYMVANPDSEVMDLMEPEDFVKEILIDRYDARVIVAGNNCRFGKSGAGNIEILRSLSGKYNFELICCEIEELEGKPISDDWVYREITEGDLETVGKLLGHPFTLWGKIIHGKALGRTVGMPTANMGLPEKKLIPKHGVYATLTEIDGEWFQGLTNIGLRPSVDNQTHVTVETFLLDFSKDIYGKEVRLELHHYIRGVKKFNNLEEVKQQVKLDIMAVKDQLNVCINERSI